MKRITGVAALTLTGLFQCQSRAINLGHNPLTAGGSGGVASAGSTSGNAGNSSRFAEPRFGTIELVTELAASDDKFKDENPTLTTDLLEIYFTSNRDGGAGSDDVWMAQRSEGDDSFDAPVPVTTVNTALSESSPAISADGKVLWIGVEPSTDADAGFVGVGGRDIWRFERTGTAAKFGTPTNETTLNSGYDDIPRPLGNGQRTMPLASRRAGTDAKYTTYLATRPSLAADFAAPVLLEELVVDDLKLTDAFLTDDGLDMYFVRGVDDSTGDIYVAHRETPNLSFGSAIALSTINTDGDERDPWLSPDGSRIYFVSDRNGPKRIYQAYRITD